MDTDFRHVAIALPTVLAGMLLTLTAFSKPSRQATSYDPLSASEDADVRQIELQVQDGTRDRTIPVLVYLPDATSPSPVILFSHGLGGTRHAWSYLGKHWARRGFVGVFMQHPGSDDSVWRDVKRGDRMDAMENAASGRNFMDRVRDVPAVLDQLERWGSDEDHALAGRLDLQHVGMCGHSFGAVTTQAVSGQTYLRQRPLFTDHRIDAAIAFSPSPPRRGDPAKAFGSVRIPWMLMTGTHDTAAIGHADATARLKVFPYLPRGDKYELVLNQAEHSVFTDRRLPGDQLSRNPNHHKAILALSTAFWDAYLADRDNARAWLQGDSPTAMLDPADRWQTK